MAKMFTTSLVDYIIAVTIFSLTHHDLLKIYTLRVFFIILDEIVQIIKTIFFKKVILHLPDLRKIKLFVN